MTKLELASRGRRCSTTTIRPIELMVTAMTDFLISGGGWDGTRNSAVEYASYLWAATICYDKLVGWGKGGRVNPTTFLSFCERSRSLVENYRNDNTVSIKNLAESFVNDLLPDWLERAGRAGDAGNC